MIKSYLTSAFFKKIINFLHKNWYLVVIGITSVILLEVYIISTKTDITFLVVLLLYAYILKLIKLSSKTTFYIALILLIFMSFEFVFLGAALRTERIAVWVFLLLTFGIVHELKK